MISPAEKSNYRLYSFVAGLYLNELQKGLQTAHTVSELYSRYTSYSGPISKEKEKLDEWAGVDKTIIILNALNSKGVKDVAQKLSEIASTWSLPWAIFHEDEDSLNGAATAVSIVVPQKYWDVEFIKPDPTAPAGSIASGGRYKYTHVEDGVVKHTIEYAEVSGIEYQLVHLLKSYRMA